MVLGMTMMEQIELLKKYENGRDLDSEDVERVNMLCGVGFMKKGVSVQRGVVTAKTLDLGSTLLNGQ